MSVRQNGVIIAGSGSGSVDVDNSTITTNAMDEIQAVATINANTAAGATNPVYDWVGTLAEHQAQNIETLHPDWICYITDDIDGGTSVYTKSEVDTLLTGKADTATTLAGYGITDGVAKGHELVAFQQPTSGNNYTWYRKYADGWVEQGRFFTNSTTIQYGGQGDLGSFYFPVPMANGGYHISACGQGYCVLMTVDRNTTYCKPVFGAYTTNRTLSNVSVYVCGRAAS